MKHRPGWEADLDTHLDQLRELPFVHNIKLTWEPNLGPERVDALIALRTLRRTFRFALETRQTFLDHALTNALIAQHTELQRRHRLPLLLAARYVPGPTGERLAEAGVNFVDRLGNVHLKLGTEYHILRLGRRKPAREPTERRPGPALVKLLFTLIAEPDTAGWPVRKLADAAGIGKTAAAAGRERLARLGCVARTRKTAYRVADRKRLLQDFVTGYNQVLRPHLFLGQYRALETDPARLLHKFAAVAKRIRAPWAATGGPAAYALERYYRGEQVPVFLAAFNPELRQELKLVPSRNGPVTLLRAFGKLYAWRTVDDVVVAHPSLIYAELLNQDGPRALDAAEQIREKYLK